MASPLIEGIDNEVLFVVSVLVIVAICLVHLLKNSNSSFSLNSRQNASNTDSVASSSSEGRVQEDSSEEQGKKSKQHRLNKSMASCLISIFN